MIVDCASYRDGQRVELRHDESSLALARGQLAPGDFIWIGLHEPSKQELQRVADAFALHPLAVEDAVSAHQRPKLELYQDSLFLTVKTLWYVDAEDAVETGEINIFLGPDFVVTVRHGQGLALAAARTHMEARAELLQHGPAAVVYAACDLIVDGYEEVAEALENDVDEVETSVFSPGRTRDSARIYTLKREISEMRRAVFPLRDPMRRFASGQVRDVPADIGVFFRDVADHLARVAESIDALDMLLSTAFDAHLAGISVQQNEDMRKISAGVALVVVPTFIAGVYGMNFALFPANDWDYGFAFAVGVMLASIGVLFALFKRSGWF